MNPFMQQEPAVSIEWGPRGARMAAERGDILVVVDVLRFSSAAAAAVSASIKLIPALTGEEEETARREGAVVAVHSLAAMGPGQYSLSPSSFETADSGVRVVISSANGAPCARYAQEVEFLFAAGLVNARTVGRAVNRVVAETGLGVTVLACGERWLDPSEEGDLRFAMEDYLGAGAVLSHLTLSLSPEAQVCRAAYESSRKDLRGILWNCESGRELREKGLADDVDWCSALDTLSSVPILRNGGFQDYSSLDTNALQE